MNKIASNFKLPFIIATALLLPFIILELINVRSPKDFPIVLFCLMWLLSVSFVFLLILVARRLWAGNEITANPMALLIRLALMIPIAWLWVSLVVDQMPCFLGVPNCD